MRNIYFEATDDQFENYLQFKELCHDKGLKVTKILPELVDSVLVKINSGKSKLSDYVQKD